MAGEERRLQVGVVAEQFERSVELRFAEHLSPTGLSCNDAVPCRPCVKVGHHLRRNRAPCIHQLRIEERAAELAHRGIRSGHAVLALCVLCDICEVRYLYRHQEIAAAQSPRKPLTVPAREGLPESGNNPIAQSKAAGETRAHRAVSDEGSLDRGHAGCNEFDSDPGARDGSPMAPGVSKHVAQDPCVRPVDLEHAGAERDVVAEDLRQLE